MYLLWDDKLQIDDAMYDDGVFKNGKRMTNWNENFAWNTIVYA